VRGIAIKRCPVNNKDCKAAGQLWIYSWAGASFSIGGFSVSGKNTNGAGEFVTGASGVKLAVTHLGADEAIPIVLSHGGGQTRHSWGATARLLAMRGYQVLTVDLRGHGDSEWSDSADYSLDAFRDDLAAVLRNLHRSAVLIGASLGGIASLLVAGEIPREKVAALVLVDITTRPAPEGSKRIQAFMKANLQGFRNIAEAADSVARYLPNRPRPSDPTGLKKNLRDKGGRLYWHWDPCFIDIVASAVNDGHMRLVAAARGVSVPTLLVRGERSDVVLPNNVAEFLSLIPSAEVADILGAGHMVAGDINTVFADAILGYLDRLGLPKS
jgi:pimeloyl-ACP methyl ester carboxylesterase